jgi:hypothetical protein
MSERSRLSESDVADMRAKRSERPWLWSYRALAEWFGCGQSTARDIVLGRTRKKGNVECVDR